MYQKLQIQMAPLNILLGRIINDKYFDGYELRKSINGTYSLHKIETDQTLHLCNQ